MFELYLWIAGIFLIIYGGFVVSAGMKPLRRGAVRSGVLAFFLSPGVISGHGPVPFPAFLGLIAGVFDWQSSVGVIKVNLVSLMVFWGLFFGIWYVIVGRKLP